MNKKTTLTGVLLLVVSMLSSLGFINEDIGENLENLLPQLVGFISSLILIFKSRDSKKKQ